LAAFAFFLVTLLTLLAWAWLRQQPASGRGVALLKLGAVLAIPLFGYLALSGRLHIVGLLLALAYPLVRRFGPALMQRHKKVSGAGQQSTVTSRILEMSLDHDSGQMFGRVLEGPLEGTSLEQLEEQQFMELLHYCRERDSDSARLLETYLDRRFGESWRVDDRDDDAHENSTGASAGSSDLTREEAYEILGLSPDASPEAITRAHRRLIQKLHPDRGGSAYLAARINAARKLLLG